MNRLAFIGLMFLCASAQAASIVHKGALVVSGSGFGTKPAQSQTVWDNGDDWHIGAFDGSWPTLAGAGSANYITYRAAQRSIPMPHSRVTRYIAGAHNPGNDAESGFNVAFWKNRTISGYPVYSYWSWLQRFDDGWTFGQGSPPDENTKLWSFSVCCSIYEIPNNWYLEYNPRPTSAVATPSFAVNDDGASLQCPDQNSHSCFWSDAINPYSGVWTRIEVEIKITDQTNGYFKVWENGALLVDYAGSTDKYTGTTRTEGIGGYSRGYGSSTQWRYYSDAFHDRDCKRFVLTDNATYASATKFEPQPYTAWSATSVTLTINAGSLPAGTVHLHFRDCSGGTHQYIGSHTLTATTNSYAPVRLQ